MTKTTEISDYTLMARHGAREIKFPWAATIADLGWVDFEFTAAVSVWAEYGQIQWRLSEIDPDAIPGVGLTAWRRGEPGIRGAVFAAAEAWLRADDGVDGFNATVAETAISEGIFEGEAA